VLSKSSDWSSSVGNTEILNRSVLYLVPSSSSHLFLQLIEALSLYLHDSPFYPVLSQLSPPDHTNPTATTTFAAQCAIQDSLPIFEEIVSIYENEETVRIESEVKKRRERLGAPSPDQIRKDVDQEILSNSKVCSVITIKWNATQQLK
jgi:hypothetical protein